MISARFHPRHLLPARVCAAAAEARGIGFGVSCRSRAPASISAMRSALCASMGRTGPGMLRFTSGVSPKPPRVNLEMPLLEDSSTDPSLQPPRAAFSNQLLEGWVRVTVPVPVPEVSDSVGDGDSEGEGDSASAGAGGGRRRWRRCQCREAGDGGGGPSCTWRGGQRQRPEMALAPRAAVACLHELYEGGLGAMSAVLRGYRHSRSTRQPFTSSGADPGA